MTTREKRMLSFMGALAVGGVLFGAYQMIWVPLKQAQADETRLIGEVDEKQDALDKLNRDLKRLPAAKKRSLPANVDVAKREYEATLSYLLRDSGVPPGYTIVPKDGGDSRAAPELGPKKPAYVRIGYDIRMQKVELPVLIKVLKGYYDLNLLHQITNLDVKRVEKEGNNGGIARRGADRADLEVSFHTDAIILDGAENRRTLLPIPESVAAVGGNAAYFAMQNLPEASRKQRTQLFPSVLATDMDKQTRDYLVMEARDAFHGPLPIVKEKEKEPESKVPIFGPKKLEDISPYIVFNGITTSSAGVRAAMIWDRSINHLYEVSILEGDGKPEVRAKKFYFLRGQLKPLERNSELVIGEDGTATNLTFKVIGFHEDGLVLTRQIVEGEGKDKDAKPAADPKKPAARPQGGRDAGKDKTPAKATKEQLALASALGGVGMTKPTTTEAVFFWRIGKTLASLQPLPPAEGQELLKKATVGPPSPTISTETPPLPPGLQN